MPGSQISFALYSVYLKSLLQNNNFGYTLIMVLDINQRMLTTQETAQRLGVSTARVSALVKNGDLQSIAVGKTRLITALSVAQHQHQDSRPGRLFAPHIALGTLYLLSGVEATWLNAKERYRIRNYLKTVKADRLARLCARRATTMDMWCPSDAIPMLVSDIAISAATGELAVAFGLARTDKVEGYIASDSLEYLVDHYDLETDLAPSTVRLHISELIDKQTSSMPVGICAVDLTESFDIRERNAGLVMLEHLLTGFRSNSAREKVGNAIN